MRWKSWWKRVELMAVACLLLVCVMAVWATSITVITPKGPYPGVVAAEALDFTWTAASGTEDTFAFTGQELILANNTGVGEATITFNSQPDQYNRKADIEYSLGAGEYAAFWAGSKIGWATGTVFSMQASSADVKWAVIRIP